MRTCQQCGKIFYNITDKDVICDFCKKGNEKELRHLSRSNNLNTCISKIFLIDNVVYSNYFLPLLVKYKINQSAAIRKLIEYAVAHPDILTDKIELKNNTSLVDKFVDYFVKNIDVPITKTDLRATKFINGNKFKSFWDNNIDEIIQKVNLQGYKLYEVKGYKNCVSYLVQSK